MEKSRLPHLFLVLVTFILSSHGGDAKGEVDVDMLNKLKDSGALDNIKEELEKMLDAKEGTDGDVPIAQAYLHLQGYVKENNLKVTEKLIKAFVKMASTSDNQIKHFGVLDEVVTSMDKLLTKGPNFNEKLNAEISDALTALTEKFKSVEELRDMLKAQEQARDKTLKNLKNEEPSKTEDNSNEFKNPMKNSFTEGLTVDNIVQGINMFSGVVKTNPDMIINYVTTYLEKGDYVSKKTLNMVANYARNFAKSDYFTIGVDYFGTSVTKVVSTPGGRQMLELIPSLVQADSRDTIVEMIKSQTESQWENFFNAINNSDLRDAFLVKVATMIDYVYSKILLDDMKMMMANAFLLTQNLPTITPRRLLPSIVELVSKSIKVFSALDVDMTMYEKMAKDLSNQFAAEYVNSNEYKKLKEHERIRVITRFMEESCVISMIELWTAHQHVIGKAMPIMALDNKDKTPRDVTRNLHCAENLLCNINAHSRKESSMIRKTTSKGLSLAMAWMWGSTGLDLDTMKLYSALHSGADILKGVDCDEKYPVSSSLESCKIFDWQADKMSLSFDDKELPKATTQEKPPKHEEL